MSPRAISATLSRRGLRSSDVAQLQMVVYRY